MIKPTNETPLTVADPTVTVSASGVDPSLPTHCDHGVSLDNPCYACRTAPGDDLAYAARLASHLAVTFYPQQTWVPLDTMSGVLSQIDNMICGLPKPMPTTGAIEAAKEVVRHLSPLRTNWAKRWLAGDNTKAGKDVLEAVAAIISRHLPPEAPSISEAIADERERAARVCEDLVTFDPEHEKWSTSKGDVCGWCGALEKAAALIRNPALKETTND